MPATLPAKRTDALQISARVRPAGCSQDSNLTPCALDWIMAACKAIPCQLINNREGGQRLNRREFLAVTGASTVGAALASVPRFSSLAALPPAKPDFTLRIAPVSVEIAPGTVINTIGYNGKALGPILRMREGKRAAIDIYNDTDIPELVHWHGQF